MLVHGIATRRSRHPAPCQGARYGIDERTLQESRPPFHEATALRVSLSHARVAHVPKASSEAGFSAGAICRRSEIAGLPTLPPRSSRPRGAAAAASPGRPAGRRRAGAGTCAWHAPCWEPQRSRWPDEADTDRPDPRGGRRPRRSAGRASFRTGRPRPASAPIPPGAAGGRAPAGPPEDQAGDGTGRTASRRSPGLLRSDAKRRGAARACATAGGRGTGPAAAARASTAACGHRDDPGRSRGRTDSAAAARSTSRSGGATAGRRTDRARA